MGENDEFYTTDTEAYLVFNLQDEDFYPQSAALTLENRNDGSLKTETVDVIDGLIEWEMPQRYIEHFGNWQGQLIYEDIKDGQPELYTSGTFSFVVNPNIGDNKRPSLVEIENWEKFIRDGTELIETWEDLDALREENERQRQENEQDRESAESVRVSNESERELNEEERISKDSERDSKIEAIEEAAEVAVTNEIINGSFTKGTEGWGAYNGSITTSGNTIQITGDFSNRLFQLWQPSDFQTGRKYYLAAHLKVVENISLIRLRSYPELVTLWQLDAPSHSEWVRASAIYDGKNSLTRTLYFTFEGEGIGVAELKHPLIIDLTETFGAGNEPTAEEMDRLLERFPNSWFDGTVNLFNAKYVMEELSKKANKQQEEWISPTLLNGATGTIKYRKNELGNTEISGRLTVVASGIVLQLPAGYRISDSRIFIVSDNLPSAANSFKLYITNQGHMSINASSGTFFISVTLI